MKGVELIDRRQNFTINVSQIGLSLSNGMGINHENLLHLLVVQIVQITNRDLGSLNQVEYHTRRRGRLAPEAENEPTAAVEGTGSRGHGPEANVERVGVAAKDALGKGVVEELGRSEPVRGVLAQAQVDKGPELGGPVRRLERRAVVLGDVVQGTHGVHVEVWRLPLGCKYTDSIRN